MAAAQVLSRLAFRCEAFPSRVHIACRHLARMRVFTGHGRGAEGRSWLMAALALPALPSARIRGGQGREHSLSLFILLTGLRTVPSARAISDQP